MFGDQKTMREIIREQKRMVDRAARALERDRQNLEREEKKLIADIKKMAKENRIVRHRHPLSLRGTAHRPTALLSALLSPPLFPCHPCLLCSSRRVQ